MNESVHIYVHKTLSRSGIINLWRPQRNLTKMGVENRSNLIKVSFTIIIFSYSVNDKKMGQFKHSFFEHKTYNSYIKAKHLKINYIKSNNENIKHDRTGHFERI